MWGCHWQWNLPAPAFQVTGIDKSVAKVDRIGKGESYIGDVASSVIKDLVQSRQLKAVTSFEVLEDVDTVNICVPTPLRKTKDPDMSYVLAACEEVARYIHPGMLIILESTTYPGTTKEVLMPMFERESLKIGEDIFLCFSPERVDPGNPTYSTANIPKVVGGITPACTAMGHLFYSQAIETVVPVRSTQVAEMVKLLENTFRMINIGLVNEMALMCAQMGIDVWEVIDAAATKPFGFMPFYPGPGLGGHCIPIDPFYLSWKSKQSGTEARFIELAGYINGQMPHVVVQRIQAALNEHGKAVKGSHTHVLGVAYKRNIDDVRESPALDVMSLLQKLGAKVTFSDPHVPALELNSDLMLGSDLDSSVASADCVVLITDHSAFDYDRILENAQLIVDTRNAWKGRDSSKIFRL